MSNGKTVDVDLRIRAKNLSKATVKDLTGDVDKLTDAQERQAKAAGLAASSMAELLDAQRRAAALAKELGNRRDLSQKYIAEREEIDRLSKKIVELTALRQRAATAAASKKAPGVQLGGLDQQIVGAEKQLRSLTTTLGNTRNKLESVGIETADIGKSMAGITSALAGADKAYDRATTNVLEYAGAVDKANAAQAEAARRTRQETDVRSRQAAALRETVGRKNEAATLKADIQLRAAQARAMEISIEAARRLRNEQDLEASTLARNNAGVREAIGRLNEMSVLKADIIRRSKETIETQNKETATAERAQRALDTQNDRRQRLINLIQSEKGQRLLALEAQRAGISQDDKSAAAKKRLEKATKDAGREQSLFADTGRKSLSVYQRIRGQVLGLAAAYIGVYQAIGTVSDALAAVNRDQALKIGLNTANSGDVKKAASDYKFLREEADRLGIVFDDIAPKYANMLIAANAVGISAKETRKLFSDVATSVAAGNLSIDDSEGVFRAVVQVMGKARVQAEELRGQLGDRLPGAVAEFAKANGIALADLDKHLKDGKGSLEEFLKFMGDYAQKFAPSMVAVTDRLQGSINRAKNAYNDWLRNLLNGENQGKLKQAFKAIEDFFEGTKGQEFAEGLGKAFGILVDTVIWLAENIDLVVKALKIFIGVQAIKFALDLAGSINTLALGLASMGKAAAGAAVGVTGTATAMSRLKLAATGIAALLVGITIAINSQSEALEAAEQRARRYANLLDKIGRRQGVMKAATADEAYANVNQISEAIAESEARLEGLQKVAAKAVTPMGRLALASQQLRETFTGGELKDLQLIGKGAISNISQTVLDEKKKLANLRQSLIEESEGGMELAVTEAINVDKNPDKPYTPPTKKDKEEKGSKGPDPEAIARRQEAAEDAAAKKIIDLQDDIASARIESAARSDAQIEANFAATVERISLDIDKKRLEIDALERAAEAAGNAGDPVFQKKIANARELLVVLDAAKMKRAEEEMITAKIELREKAINDLIAERDAKIQLQNTLKETGQQGELTTLTNVNALQEEYNEKIRTLIAEFTTFIASLDPEGELYKRLGLDKVLLGMQQINAENAKLSTGQKFVQKWGETFATAGGNILEAFANATVATGKLKDGFAAARDAFLQFAADFLMQIAQMIIKTIILNAISNFVNGTSGGYGAALKNALTASGHTGGVVGSSNNVGANPRRMVSPTVFAGAQRFHEGGLPGLRKDEVATILKKGEEVVTEDNPRHIGNAGGAAPSINVTAVNVLDREEMAGEILKAQAAGPLLLNFVSRNATAVKQRLGLK